MRLNKSVGLILIILSGLTRVPVANAQTEALDSLNRALNLTMDEGQRIRNLNLIAFELRHSDPEKSMIFAQRALELANKTENETESAFAQTTKGMLYEANDDFTLALNCYLEALNIYLSLESDEDLSRIYYKTGLLYKTLGNYEKSIEHCLEGLKISEKLGDKSGIALIYRVMGSVYKYKEDYDKSLFYYYNGLKINEEINNTSGIANSNNNIGVVYFIIKDFDKALDCYRKSLAINLADSNQNAIAINYGNICNIYLEKGLFDSAKIYMDNAYEISISISDRKGIAGSLEDYGNFYFRKKDYNMAVDFYLKALDQTRVLGLMENTKNLLKNLSDLYIEKSDYKKAWHYFNSYIGVRDSLLNKVALQKMEQIEMEYKFEKERNEHKLIEQRKKFLNTVGYFALIAALVSLVIIFMILKIKLKQKNLEEKALQMEKQQLQNEIYFKDKEVFSKAVHLAEKNELINDITKRLGTVLLNPGTKNSAVRDIIKELKFNSNTKTWEEFECTFLKVNPDFFNSLGRNFPSLTPNERRLCAFLKLNLSTKDISTITHQSLHSLNVARTRLRKKLGIANTGENLTTFLNQL